MKPARGIVFCRPVKTAERFAGSSIVLLEDTRMRWTGQQAEVVAVGNPAVCEDEDCERHHTGYFLDASLTRYHWLPAKDGDWILVEPRMFIEVADNLWALGQDQVLAILTP